MIFDYQSNSLEDTQNLAAGLAPLLKQGDVVTLSGTLGTGKTAFARALIQARFGAEVEVPSPTFNLLLVYEDGPNSVPVYHYDMFRIEAPEEVFELDLEDALDYGICLIEWADHMGPYIPDDLLEISFKHLEDDEKDKRTILFDGSEEWKSRLSGLFTDG